MTSQFEAAPAATTDPTAEAATALATALSGLAGLAGAIWPEADRSDLVGLTVEVAEVCAEVHGLAPLVPPGGVGMQVPAHDADADADVLGFAEQFSVDVSSITGDQRRALFTRLGERAATFTAIVFVADFVPRARAALGALGLGGTEAEHARDAGGGLWEALDHFTRVVPRLTALDPVTTELVRLRGARQHQCRLCQSLRSRPALLAGADEATFSTVDDYRHSRLDPAQQAALAFTDAMIWTPGRLDGDVVDDLAGTTTAAQQFELVLDVTRNALNKVAVALAADAPHVEEGVEIYDIDPDGELLYGLTLD
jgi:alkylhydroperoxidase family enzyme